MRRSRLVALSDLLHVIDPTPVEHMGGPNDGEFRRADENGSRPNGIYIVVSQQQRPNGEWRVIEKMWVPA
jgi:hypothetical protein